MAGRKNITDADRQRMAVRFRVRPEDRYEPSRRVEVASEIIAWLLRALGLPKK